MKRILGIELGSTRIKAVLINEKAEVIVEGAHEWESSLVDGLWSYSLDEVKAGLRASFRALSQDYAEKFGESLRSVDAIGVSAMMHGYLAFDSEDKLLVPFRTWRNSNTAAAADELTELFGFNIPMRWSVSHYYNAVKLGEEHIKDVAHLTTLSGYVHYKLTGKRVIGLGDASGMFPVSSGGFDEEKLALFNSRLKENGVEARFESLLPTPLYAGEFAGVLTEEGARFLDESGELLPGAVLCPPEGDGGTGMVATGCVAPKSANVSAGTSVFLMAVLESEPEFLNKNIAVVRTPHGAAVAMVNANSFTTEITAWVNLFCELAALCGGSVGRGELYERLFLKSAEADADLGGLLGYNFLSAEPVVDISDAAPLIIRKPGAKLTLSNFMKMNIYSALASFAVACELLSSVGVEIEEVVGHGGFFKTPAISCSAMSAAVGAPVTVMKNAGEGGAWGISLRALFTYSGGGNLEKFLADIFRSSEKITLAADECEKRNFNDFLERYKRGLSVAKLAGKGIN